MTRKLIAIDDGHGMQTPGKRTPLFPDGTYMPENDFNRAVAAKLDTILQRCGFDTLPVAPGDADVPLKTRTDLANNTIRNKYNRKADFYISIHANAGGGTWETGGRGIESIHYPGAAGSAAKAKIIQKWLVKGTKLPDRGVKAMDLHVCRETDMDAVLVECGFMDNREEAQLLKSDAYRTECAEELAQAICEIYGTAYVKPPTEQPQPGSDNTCKIEVQTGASRATFDGMLQDGKSYAPVRAILEALGYQVGWDANTKTVTAVKK